MKKTLFSLTFMLAVSLNTSAQLHVDTLGHASVGGSIPSLLNTIFRVGINYNNSSSYKYGIYSSTSGTSNTYDIGVRGSAYSTSNAGSGRSIGVQGVAGNHTDGYNFGVLGVNSGTYKGAGVFGTLSNSIGKYINGKYAGYFDGATYVDGTLTATQVVTPSDIQLKENIVNLSDGETRENTLEKLLAVNVLQYNYKKRPVPEAEADTATVIRAEDEITKQRHYGVSAQELQTLFPDLVVEGQDGYLGVNYVELVPILIRSIQELEEKIEILEGKPETRSAQAKQAITATRIETAIAQQNRLFQNDPNPFKEHTEIRYQLADDTRDASVCIFDLQGKMLKKVPVLQGSNSVAIDGGELGAGMFLYSLIVNGQEADTKRMILSK